jgi:hypothetical protein
LTAQTEHSPFPTDETLAAYIDGRLDEETRRRVVEHLADCAECFEAMQVSQEMAAEAPAEGRIVQWPRNALIGLATAAAVGAVLFLTPLRDRVWPHDDIGALAAVAPPTRSYEGRLTRFPHSEFKRMRGGNQEQPEDSVDLEAPDFYLVAGEVQKRAIERPDARTLHAEGISLLIQGKSKNAVDTLEKARQSSSSPDPQLLSDLAVAYLATGKYAEALQYANLAWGMAQTPEIAWNRALAEEYLHHHAEAIAAWKDYLNLDRSSKWVPDAKSHLDRLQSE